ncbi:hypothetical protein GJAV_G00102310 [Gymnothorax javanicus]|nr:hypothetical protein GJAV_G00102310 [Gymnothorax javanicus]
MSPRRPHLSTGRKAFNWRLSDPRAAESQHFLTTRINPKQQSGTGIWALPGIFSESRVVTVDHMEIICCFYCVLYHQCDSFCSEPPILLSSLVSDDQMCERTALLFDLLNAPANTERSGNAAAMLCQS